MCGCNSYVAFWFIISNIPTILFAAVQALRKQDFGFFHVTFRFCQQNFSVVEPGPKFPPTKGEVWPKPQLEWKEESYFVYKPSQFHISAINHTCDILRRAIERYSFTLRTFQHITRWSTRRAAKNTVLNSTHAILVNGTISIDKREIIQKLDIDLSSACEDYPYLGMDESYELTVEKCAFLKSDSIWGVLRGLETFTHLFYLTDDYSEVRINNNVIFDFPRYQHRGLLLDTSRHFVSLNNILKTLNAMSMNKLNVFHWHIVDDQSFPYQSEKFPQLSGEGAYHHTMVYTKEDIEAVIKYATDRGIRVIPEFDVPGHTRSWGQAFPDILTKCYKGDNVVGLGPMDPTQNATYKLLEDLIAEIQAWFPDKFFHVGGDEVELECWASNPQLRKYMEEHRMNPEQLHALFMNNVIPLLQNKSTAIVWQEVYDEEVQLEKDVLVQVWKSGSVSEMVRILKSGHKVLFSASWYLDHLATGGDWMDFYAADPRSMVYVQIENQTLLKNIIGGEACMWGEVVDDANIISRVWPRASAAAERLWSPVPMADTVFGYLPGETVRQLAANRLEEHTCRMNRRGIAAQPPNGPGFCLTNIHV